jgi:hypothetical protein
MRRRNATLAAFALALCPARVLPEVADSAANGFTLKTAMEIAATPDTVYRRFIRIGDWWESAHTFSGDSRNLSIEEKPMGCYCEKLPNQGFVRHMQVVFLSPGKMIVLNGGLGPLMTMGTTGAMTIQIAPAGSGSKLSVSYAVAGYTPQGMNSLAGKVDEVLMRQLARFKASVEHGPEGLKSLKQP